MPTWFRLDDDFYLHPKVQACEPGDVLLWITAMAWSSGRMTDGRVPLRTLVKLAHMIGVANPDAAIERLVGEGLLDPPDADGRPEYAVHGFLDRQRSAESRRAEQAAAAQRQADARARRRAEKDAERGTEDTDGGKSRRDSPGESRRSSAVQGQGQGQGQNKTPPTPPDRRYPQVLARLAEARARATPGVRSVDGLKRRLIADAEADGLADQVRALIRDHPDASTADLVDLATPAPNRPPVFGTDEWHAAHPTWAE